MRQPETYTPTEIKRWSTFAKIDGKMISARPLGHRAWSWKHRWKLAWQVLTGKADVLKWEGEQ